VAIANGKNGVIHIHGAILAGGGGIDTACVATEVINDLESDRDRLLVNGLFELSLI